MLKPSVKISSPVLRQTKLQHVKCRKFHLSSQTTFKTLAKSSTNLQKTIFSSTKTKTQNNKRWSSNSNSHAESGLEHQPAERYSYYIPNDVPPEKYAQYVSTDGILGGLVGSGGAAFALALLLLYMQSDSDELAEQLAEELAAIKKSGQGLDADTTLQKLNTVHTVFYSATPDQQALFLEFATQILEHKANPKLVAPALDILRFGLAKGTPLPISSAELIHKFTTDQFIQEITVQSALINLFNRATLTPSTRAAVANPILADYAELLMNHSEETVATKAAHVLLALARSNEHVELLGGAVHTLWNIIVRNNRDEAVGYAKETLSLISARAATSKNEQFKQTVESQIQQARIHPKALETIAGYRNTHFFSGAVGSNLITAVVAAGWGLVRWHTQLARSGYHIDTPTARKIVSMRLAPTVVASLLLLNFAKMLNVDSPTKKSIVPEYPLLVFTAGMVASVAPFTVVPATVGYFWPKFATRKSIAKDSEYQY